MFERQGKTTSVLPQRGRAATKKENQKRTQRRRDAKKAQSFLFWFSLRDLSAFASLRESFCFFCKDFTL
jgi:hypothetical protein